MKAAVCLDIGFPGPVKGECHCIIFNIKAKCYKSNVYAYPVCQFLATFLAPSLISVTRDLFITNSFLPV